jgi:hypothetical protein
MAKRVRKTEHPHLYTQPPLDVSLALVPAQQLFLLFLRMKAKPDPDRLLRLAEQACGPLPLNGSCPDRVVTDESAEAVALLREFLIMRELRPPHVLDGLATVSYADVIRKLDALKPSTRQGYQRALNSLMRGDWLRYAPVRLLDPVGDIRVDVARAMRETFKQAKNDGFRTHRAVLKLMFQ